MAGNHKIHNMDIPTWVMYWNHHYELSMNQRWNQKNSVSEIQTQPVREIVKSISISPTARIRVRTKFYINMQKFKSNQLSNWHLNIPGTVYSNWIKLRISRWCNHTKRLCDGNSTLWKLDYTYAKFGYLEMPLKKKNSEWEIFSID